MEARNIILKKKSVRYYSAGAAENEINIIFLHGWRSEALIWQKIIHTLPQDGFNCFALDLPGFGKSEAPTDFFTIQDYADVVLEFINKLKLTNVVLIGHSFGGRIAIKIAAENFLFIKSIVLVDSAGIKVTSLGSKIKLFFAKLVKPLFKLKFLKNAKKGIYKIIGSEDYLATPALQKTFVHIINEDLTQLLPLIEVPALLLWGEKDKNPNSSLEHALVMKNLIKDSKLMLIPNAAHFSFLDNPHSFIAKLKDFLHN